MQTKRYTALAAALLLAIPATAQENPDLWVYEGFDYTDVGDSLLGKGGTSEKGLQSTWENAVGGGSMYLKEGSLQFGDLPVSGNHIGYLSNADSDIYNRQLTTTVTSAIGDIGTANGALYFSFLFEKLQNNFNADREGFALMNGVLPHARFDGSNNPGAEDRHGFAVAAVGSSYMQAVIFDGTAGTREASAGSVPITVVNGSSNTATNNVAVRFIIGEIQFNAGTGDSHVFNLYYATNNSTHVDDLVLAATIEGNFDESLLNTLHLTRQVNVNYDEIRIGTTLDSVLALVPFQPQPTVFRFR